MRWFKFTDYPDVRPLIILSDENQALFCITSENELLTPSSGIGGVLASFPDTFEFISDDNAWVAPVQSLESANFFNHPLLKIEQVELDSERVVFTISQDEANNEFSESSDQPRIGSSEDDPVVSLSSLDPVLHEQIQISGRSGDVIEGHTLQDSSGYGKDDEDSAFYTTRSRDIGNRSSKDDVSGSDRERIGTNYIQRRGLTRPRTATARISANIDALRILEKNPKYASESEKEILNLYSGWGGLKAFIDVDSAQFQSLNYPPAASEIIQSLDTGYYTPDDIDKVIWSNVLDLGYRGGRVLEPSAGTGRFLTHRPESLDNSQHFTAIEIDRYAGGICKLLHEDADVHIGGFENYCQLASYSNTQFDLVVGNFPFGSNALIDPDTGDSLSIHNFFLKKAIDLLQPNGVAAIITSRYFLDEIDTSFRNSIKENAGLIGAVRLPNSTFDATEVGADVLFFIKRSTPNAKPFPNEIDFIDTDYFLDAAKKQVTLEDLEARLNPENKIFTAGLPNVISIGHRYVEKNRFGDYSWQYSPVDIGGIWSAIQSLNLSQFSEFAFSNENLLNNFGKPNYEGLIVQSEQPIVGSLMSHEGKIKLIDSFSQKLISGSGDPHNPAKVSYVVYTQDINAGTKNVRFSNGNKYPLIELYEDFILLRKQADHVMRLASSGIAVETELDSLKSNYERFYEKYGPVNSRQVRGLVGVDSLASNVFGLEVYNPKDDTARPCDWLLGKFKVLKDPITSCENLREAAMVIFSRGEGYSDDSVRRYIGVGIDEAMAREPGILFKIVEDEKFRYVHAIEYLVGNVKQKLSEAKEWHEKYGGFHDNINYLENVLPDKIDIADIKLSIGCSWIPDEIIVEFIKAEFSKHDAEVLVEVIPASSGSSKKLKIFHYKNYSAFETVMNGSSGTARVNFERIVQSILDSTVVIVRDTIETSDGKTTSIINNQATIEANIKRDEIIYRFSEFVIRNAQYSKKIEEIYNDTINVYNYTYDSNLTESYIFPNLNPEFELKPHQRAYIVGALMNQLCMNNDPVGAGKTAIQIVLSYERKRLGLCNKPAIVILPHTLDSYGREVKRLYPTANVCLVGKDDLVGAARKSFVGRVAMNDWDLVVMPYTIMGKLSAPLDYLEAEHLKRNAEADNMFRICRSKNDKRGASKALQMMRDNNRTMERYRHEYSTNIRIPIDFTFIDSIVYDEAHKLKNLQPIMSGDILGLPLSSSAIAMNEFNKINYIRQKYHNGREVAVDFFTATPLSNSMAELYTWKRMLRPSMLDDMGIKTLNDWVASFASHETSLETTPEGDGFQFKTRLTRFRNIPELLAAYRSMSQITPDSELDIVRPTPKEEILIAPQNPYQKAINDWLIYRAKCIRARKPLYPNDILLAIVTLSGQVSINHRALAPYLPDAPSKIDLVAEKIYQHWIDSRDFKGVQLVFSDTSVPGGSNTEFNSYSHLKTLLVRMGVPQDEIQFVHDAKTDAAKSKMFELARMGEISVLMGSTEKLGTGSNVQDRVIAAYDLDIPWTDKAFVQRRGRSIRQGNLNENVTLYRAATHNSTDTFRYETVKRKAELTAVAMASPKLAEREFVEEAPITYEVLIASSTGNELIKKKFELEGLIKTLDTRIRSEHDVAQRELNLREEANSNLGKYERILTGIEQIKASYSKVKANIEMVLTNAKLEQGKNSENFSDAQVSSLTKLSVDNKSVTVARFKELWVEAISNNSILDFSMYGVSFSLARSYGFSQDCLRFELNVLDDDGIECYTSHFSAKTVKGIFKAVNDAMEVGLTKQGHEYSEKVDSYRKILSRDCEYHISDDLVTKLAQARSELADIETEILELGDTDTEIDREPLSPRTIHNAWMRMGKPDDFDPLNIPDEILVEMGVIESISPTNLIPDFIEKALIQ